MHIPTFHIIQKNYNRHLLNPVMPLDTQKNEIPSIVVVRIVRVSSLVVAGCYRPSC